MITIKTELFKAKTKYKKLLFRALKENVFKVVSMCVSFLSKKIIQC